MVFSSPEFLFIFMPVFFTLYYLVPWSFKNTVLLLGSLAFYFAGSFSHPLHMALLLLSIITDFYAGIFMEKSIKYRKPVFIFSLLFHIASLCIFKYSGFVSGEIAKIIPGYRITEYVLPVGISFYTFQGISYLADVYGRKCPAEKSLVRFGIYISMFEQLIAGPVVTYSSVKNQLCSRKITKKSALRGFSVFVFGMGLKVLLANPLGKIFTEAEKIGFESISSPFAWLCLSAFTMQIFLDFFGYSLMAVGLGRMLGFRIPKNFDFPYESLSMTEFWRRWHITLGSWFRDYVYIPLGGSRKGKFRTVINLFAVWLLTGMWHGAGYNFIIWGMLLFVLITLEKFVYGKYLVRYPVAGRIYMLVTVPLSWAVFAVEDIKQTGIFFTRLFPFLFSSYSCPFPGDFLKYLKIYLPFLIIGGLFCTSYPYKLLKKIKNRHLVRIIILLIFISGVYCIYRGFDDPFLYFRF